MPISAGYISDSQDSEDSFFEFPPAVYNSPQQQPSQDSSSKKGPVDDSRLVQDDLADELILAVSSTRVVLPLADIPDPHQQEISSQTSITAGFTADHTPVNTTSSPLTPVSQISSGEKSPKLQAVSNANEQVLFDKKNGDDLTQQQDGLESSSQAIPSPPINVNLSNDYAPERRFRPRTAAQLNPYLYERKRYEALMKIRGIRPIRVATHPHELTEQPPQDSNSPNQHVNKNITGLSRKRAKIAHTYGHNTVIRENSPADNGVLENTPIRHPRRIPDFSSQESPENVDIFANIPIELDRDSDTDYGAATSDDNESSPTSQQSGQTQDAELELYRRRIRGVLPATFLTIEQATKKRQQRHAHRRPVLREGPGIAKKKIAQTPMESDLAHLRDRLGVSDDEDQDGVGDKINGQKAQFTIFSDDSSSENSVEAIEKEVFDRMLSRAPRQKRLDFRSTKPNPTHGHSEHRKYKKRKVIKSNYNRAGIVDAVKSYRLQNPSSKRVPPFMKIASRTTKRLVDKGRTSPTGKVFHFSDESDSDLQTTLREWRDGTAEPVNVARNALLKQSARNHNTTTNHDRSSIRSNHMKTATHRHAPSAMRPPSTTRRVLGTARPLFGVPMRKNIEYRQAQVEAFSGKYATTATSIGRSLVRRKRQTRLNNVLENCRSKGMGAPVPDLDTTQIVPLNNKDDLTRYGPMFQQQNTNFTQRKKPTVTRRRELRHSNALPKFQDIRLPARNNSVTETTQQVSIRQFFFPVQTFTTTFNIFPLSSNIRFNETFFLGRGYLHHVLGGNSEQMDINVIPPEVKVFDDIINHETDDLIVAEIARQVNNSVDLLSQTLDQDEPEDLSIPETLSGQSYEFFAYLNHFLSSTRFRSMDPANIRSIINLLKSQTVKASDIMSTLKAQQRFTDSAGNSFTRISYQSMFFLILALYQCFRLVNSRKDRFSDYLELDQEIGSLGKFFASYLFRYDLDNLQEHLRNARRYSKHGLSRQSNCYMLEIWVCSIHLFDKWSLGSEKLHTFWETFNNILALNDSKAMIDATYEKVEQIWSYIFSICPLYLYNDIGELRSSLVSPVNKSNWTAVGICIKRLMESFDPTAKESENSFASYFHAQLGRCLNLTTVWKWKPEKGIVLDILQFFASNMLENFSSESEGDRFPDFLTDPDHRIELSPANTSFHVFLKILCLWFQEFRHDTGACKEMVLKLNRAVALNGRSYPATIPLKAADIDALANHYSLLLTLFFVVQPDNRPTIRQIRDVIMIGASHTRARIVSAKAWSHMIALVGVDEKLISECMEWYNDLLHGALSDCAKITFDMKKKEQQDEKAWYDKLISDCLYMLERTIRRATMMTQHHKLGLILPLLCPAATSEILLSSSLSSKHLSSAMRIIEEYINVVGIVYGKQFPSNQQAGANNGFRNSNEDSADSFSSSLMSELLALEASETRNSGLRTAAQHLANVVPSSSFTQILSQIVRSDEKDFSDQQCIQFISFHYKVVQFLVENGVHDWLFYLEGGGAWRWLPDTTRKFKLEPLWLKEIYEHHPQFLVTERSFFICHLLRCLAIPRADTSYEGVFIHAILSKGRDDVLFRRIRPLAGEITVESGPISPRKMEYRERIEIISTILSNMDSNLSEVNDSDLVFTGSFNRPAAELIGVYGYYVHTLTMSLRRNYQTGNERMNIQELTDFLDFCRTIVKLIVRHCPLFLDKTGVSWFHNPSNFPLGLNKAFNYEQEFRALLRKNASDVNVQGDIMELFFHVLDLSFSQNDAELFFSSVSSAYDSKVDLHHSQIDAVACQSRNLLSHRRYLFTTIVPRFFHHAWENQRIGGWLYLSRVVRLLVRVLENTNYASGEWDLMFDLLPSSLHTIRLFIISCTLPDMTNWSASMEDAVSGLHEFLGLLIRRNLKFSVRNQKVDMHMARFLSLAKLELRHPCQSYEQDIDKELDSICADVIPKSLADYPSFFRDRSEYWEPSAVYENTSLYVHCAKAGLHLATDRNVTVPLGYMVSVQRFDSLFGLVKLCLNEPNYKAAVDLFLNTVVNVFETGLYEDSRLVRELRACIQCFLLDIGWVDFRDAKLQDEEELYI